MTLWMLAQGALTEFAPAGATAGVLAVGIAAIWKDKKKTSAEHREDWKAVTTEHRADMKAYAEKMDKAFDRMSQALENNTAAFTRSAEQDRELKHAVRNAPCGVGLKKEDD
jgi:hypothetical protein